MESLCKKKASLNTTTLIIHNDEFDYPHSAGNDEFDYPHSAGDDEFDYPHSAGGYIQYSYLYIRPTLTPFGFTGATKSFSSE